MSAISTILARLRSAIWAIDVRDDIADAIEQCYSDVSNPTLQTDALEAAIQEKIDEGEMASLTIGDGTITAAKLAANSVTTPKIADGSITQAKLDPNIDFVQVDDTLSQTGEAADAAAVGAAINELNGSLDSLIVPTASQWKALFDILDKAGYKETGVGAEIAVLRNALSGDNIFDPVTAIMLVASYEAENNRIKVANGSGSRMAAIPIEIGKTYKINKIAASAFRILFIGSIPVQPTGSNKNYYPVIYTEANHTGTEITIEAPTGSTYMCIHYSNVASETDAQATQILRSISVVEVEEST